MIIVLDFCFSLLELEKLVTALLHPVRHPDLDVKTVKWNKSNGKYVLLLELLSGSGAAYWFRLS